MDWIEVTGRSVDEARERALETLGVVEEDAEVEVLSDVKMGLFGRLREEARVRARLRPAVVRSKDDGRGRRKGRVAKAGATGAGASEDPSVTEPGEEAPTSVAPAPARTKATQPPRSAVPATSGADRPDVRREDVEEKMDEHADAVVPIALQAEVARGFVDGLLQAMGVEGTTTIVLLDEDTAEVQVTGGDLGLLIGPKGTTLLAIQDLARTVVQRRTGARQGRLLLDVSGYRQKRKEALERFTTKVASEVLGAGTPVALEPMTSADRKVVHDTANAIDGVATSSEGEDPHRRVVIRPV